VRSGSAWAEEKRHSLRGGLRAVPRARRLAALVGAALALALVSTSASLARRETTAPSQQVSVYFVITDQRIAYEILRTTTAGSGNTVLEKYVVRSDIATFIVINRGKKAHSFLFLGKKFALPPGHRAHFSKILLSRGAFPYASTTDPGKAFKGVFPVY
jgi:hypothetical protein